LDLSVGSATLNRVPQSEDEGESFTIARLVYFTSDKKVRGLLIDSIIDSIDSLDEVKSGVVSGPEVCSEWAPSVMSRAPSAVTGLDSYN
jgi:hypothetical protein